MTCWNRWHMRSCWTHMAGIGTRSSQYRSMTRSCSTSLQRKNTKACCTWTSWQKTTTGTAMYFRVASYWLVGHTMVSLNAQSKNPVDSYINANYVANPYTGEKNVFIATQGPIPASMNNFWQMVWNEMIKVIVMLCGLEEHGRVMEGHSGFLSCLLAW